MSLKVKLGLIISVFSIFSAFLLLLQGSVPHSYKQDPVKIPQLAGLKDNNAVLGTSDTGVVTVKTYFEATSLQDEWPEVALIINNGSGYDGPYDYANCANGPVESFQSGCGTPNLYSNKHVQTFTIPGPTYTHAVDIPISTLVVDPYPNSTSTGDLVSKISYVFFNDGWINAVGDRNVYINKIEFIKEGNIVLTYTPQNDSYWGGYDDYRNANESFYFDLGYVDNTGIVEGDRVNGFAKAFDKQNESMQSIVQNQSRENGKWSLTQEGSFNVVTFTLAEALGISGNEVDTTLPVCGGITFTQLNDHGMVKITAKASDNESGLIRGGLYVGTKPNTNNADFGAIPNNYTFGPQKEGLIEHNWNTANLTPGKYAVAANWWDNSGTGNTGGHVGNFVQCRAEYTLSSKAPSSCIDLDKDNNCNPDIFDLLALLNVVLNPSTAFNNDFDINQDSKINAFDLIKFIDLYITN